MIIQRSKLAKNVFILIIILLCESIGASVIHAEGGGNDPNGSNGVNRRVRSKDDGYVEVSGTISADIWFARNANGAVIAPVTTQPTFYLGGRGVARDSLTISNTIAGRSFTTGDDQFVEVDGGLEFDRTAYGSAGGWEAFISMNGYYTNPRRRTSTGWQTWRGPGREYDLHYRTDANGRLALTISGLGEFYWINDAAALTPGPGTDAPRPPGDVNMWPWSGQGTQVMNPDYFLIHSVKRVVGITQTGASTQDGSSMWCRFTTGRIYTSDARTTALTWNSARTDQARHLSLSDPNDRFGGTGYDTPETGIRAFDALNRNPLRLTGRSLPRVQFPNIDNPPGPAVTRGNFSGSHTATEAGKSRYEYETVKLNLRLPLVPTAQLRFRSR